jgi:hypothetical protein
VVADWRWRCVNWPEGGRHRRACDKASGDLFTPDQPFSTGEGAGKLLARRAVLKGSGAWRAELGYGALSWGERNLPLGLASGEPTLDKGAGWVVFNEWGRDPPWGKQLSKGWPRATNIYPLT